MQNMSLVSFYVPYVFTKETSILCASTVVRVPERVPSHLLGTVDVLPLQKELFAICLRSRFLLRLL